MVAKPIKTVSILILLDYLFLFDLLSIKITRLNSLNPYFIGLPILIMVRTALPDRDDLVSILILLDYLFLSLHSHLNREKRRVRLNPYFIGLPILIFKEIVEEAAPQTSLNPYFIGLPILIFSHHLL